MQTEIEAKFTGIDMDEMRAKLKELGAELLTPERLMRRRTYFIPGGGKAYLRVRDEGDKITMTYKIVQDRTLHGTKEINITVNSFDEASALLEAIGLQRKSDQETKRETWLLNGCELDLDTWPWIPPYVEIEGPSEDLVRATAYQLGYDWSQALFGTVEPVYQQHYDVTEDEINHWTSIPFGPVPDWLEAKRKKTPA